MNKELEEVKEWIKGRLVYIAQNCDMNDLDNKKAYNNFEIILKHIDNSISKEVVEKKIAELTEEYELLLEHQSGQESNRTKYLRGKIHMCQELLEGK